MLPVLVLGHNCRFLRNDRPTPFEPVESYPTRLMADVGHMRSLVFFSAKEFDYSE